MHKTGVFEDTNQIYKMEKHEWSKQKQIFLFVSASSVNTKMEILLSIERGGENRPV